MAKRPGDAVSYPDADDHKQQSGNGRAPKNRQLGVVSRSFRLFLAVIQFSVSFIHYVPDGFPYAIQLCFARQDRGGKGGDIIRFRIFASLDQNTHLAELCNDLPVKFLDFFFEPRMAGRHISDVFYVQIIGIGGFFKTLQKKLVLGHNITAQTQFCIFDISQNIFCLEQQMIGLFGEFIALNQLLGALVNCESQDDQSNYCEDITDSYALTYGEFHSADSEEATRPVTSCQE
ncbi:MAG TPA: hypothetical protein VGH19_04175 [Verrucomicrobiae bacterium]